MMNDSRMLQAPRALAVAALAGLVFLTAGSFAYSQTAAPADAATTFKSKCAACHGQDGSGSALGKRLHAPDLRSKDVQSQTTDALVQVVTKGKENMPAFGNRLDSDQINKLVAYIRTFHADAASPK